MKRLVQYILVSLILFSSALSVAQTDFNLVINHKLNAYDFEMNGYGMTTDSTIFSLSRLEYYLSEITITHDGGQETMISDLWVLVDPIEPTLVDLGSQSINIVESISFSVGVDPAHNFLDPSTYASGHPLAHKVPSMHWGWTAGYRFVAIEGEDLAKTGFQVHALGSSNYFEATVDITETDFVNGEEYINVFANYSRAFDGIDITNGLINHGETDEAVDLLLNFNEHVFTSAEPMDEFTMPGEEPSGLEEAVEVAELSISPNPSINNEVRFVVKATTDFNIQLFDITGKLSHQLSGLNANQTQLISNLNPGLYFLTINAVDGSFSSTKRVIVK
jgi:hypothetical protein